MIPKRIIFGVVDDVVKYFNNSRNTWRDTMVMVFVECINEYIFNVKYKYIDIGPICKNNIEDEKITFYIHEINTYGMDISYIEHIRDNLLNELKKNNPVKNEISA